MHRSRVLLGWLALMAAESLHGTLRELLLAPRIGSLPARQLAVFSGMVLIYAITWSLVRWMGLRRRRDCLLAGLSWVVATVAFEVTLGRAVLGLGWSRILEDYDPTRGGLMLLGLAIMAFAPLLAACWRGTLRTRG